MIDLICKKSLEAEYNHKRKEYWQAIILCETLVLSQVVIHKLTSVQNSLPTGTANDVEVVYAMDLNHSGFRHCTVIGGAWTV